MACFNSFIDLLGVMDVYGLACRVLIDSGASHSFISVLFANKIGKTPSSTTSLFSMSIPSGEVTESRSSLNKL